MKQHNTPVNNRDSCIECGHDLKCVTSIEVTHKFKIPCLYSIKNVLQCVSCNEKYYTVDNMKAIDTAEDNAAHVTMRYDRRPTQYKHTSSSTYKLVKIIISETRNSKQVTVYVPANDQYLVNTTDVVECWLADEIQKWIDLDFYGIENSLIIHDWKVCDVSDFKTKITDTGTAGIEYTVYNLKYDCDDIAADAFPTVTKVLTDMSGKTYDVGKELEEIIVDDTGIEIDSCRYIPTLLYGVKYKKQPISVNAFEIYSGFSGNTSKRTLPHDGHIFTTVIDGPDVAVLILSLLQSQELITEFYGPYKPTYIEDIVLEKLHEMEAVVIEGIHNVQWNFGHIIPDNIFVRVHDIKYDPSSSPQEGEAITELDVCVSTGYTSTARFEKMLREGMLSAYPQYTYNDSLSYTLLDGRDRVTRPILELNKQHTPQDNDSNSN